MKIHHISSGLSGYRLGDCDHAVVAVILCFIYEAKNICFVSVSFGGL